MSKNHRHTCFPFNEDVRVPAADHEGPGVSQILRRVQKPDEKKWKSKQLTRSQHVHIFVFAGEKRLKFQQLVSLQYFVHVSIPPPSVSAALPVLFPQKYASPSHAAALNYLTIISA